MQVDRTNIVIRARSLSEIGDLAMILVRCYPAASLLGIVVGCAPWVILNALLVGWIPLVQFGEGIYDEEMDWELARYVFLMITLVILQAPIAGVITTALIGRAVFEQRVTWRSAVTDLRQLFWRWFWVLGVLRGPVPLMLILATNWGQELAIGREILIPILFLTVVGFQRARRPFMPEILLLERCPLRAKSPAVITAGRRNAALHGPLAGELIGRFLTVAMMLGVLYLAVLYALFWVRGVMLGRWDWTMAVYLVFVPVSLWAVAGLSVLIRFLSYLDTRIRLEGWEVDLAVRAEAQRQFGESHATASTHRQRAKRRLITSASIGIAWAMLQLPVAVAAAGPATMGLDAGTPLLASVSPDEVTLPLNPSSSWYDPQNQELRPVRVQTRLPDTKHRDSRWLAPAQRTAPRIGATGSWSPAIIFGWLLLAVLAFGLSGSMLYIFSKVEPDALGPSKGAVRLGKGGPDQQDLERMQHLPSELRRSDVNLRDEAQRLMQLGRFAEAIVLLFGHQLLLLDRGGLLRLARGKTNGRYLRETRANSPEAHRLLAATVAGFEASYFGHHAPEAEQFRQLWADNAALEAIVHAKLEAAA